METISVRQARRLALARAGLLKPEWTGFPRRASGRGKRAREAAHAVVSRFGYLQLDTVSIAGARSHAIVIASRLEGFDPSFAEELLQPGQPLFEYWGHEASWIPLSLYSAFDFRRKAFHHHPWWGDLVGRHPEVARGLRRRIREEGPVRSMDLEGQKGKSGWWDLKVAKKVATALWSSGELAIRERVNFQIVYDLAERVIPAKVRKHPLPLEESLERLLLQALDGHGWAASGTLSATFRFSKMGKAVGAALKRLVEKHQVIACELENPGGRATAGWIRPSDLELAARLDQVRPRGDKGVLLSPFDPMLWDRARVRRLFDFDQILEIFKPAPQRIYGYYCLPVLAGERLVARYDLKADRKRGVLRVLSLRFEKVDATPKRDKEAARVALERWAGALGLKTERGSQG